MCCCLVLWWGRQPPGSHALVSFLLSGGCDSLLTTRLWKNERMSLKINLQKGSGFHLALSFALMEAICLVVSWPKERPVWQGTEGGLLINSRWGTESLNPTFARNRILLQTTRLMLESLSSFETTTTLANTWSQYERLSQSPDQQKLGDVCFKLLRFKVIFYTAIDNLGQMRHHYITAWTLFSSYLGQVTKPAKASVLIFKWEQPSSPHRLIETPIWRCLLTDKNSLIWTQW